MDQFADIERGLDRLEGKALLHGLTEAMEKEIAELCAMLEDLERGASDD